MTAPPTGPELALSVPAGHRTLRVMVEWLPIEDGAVPPPAVGDVAAYPLTVTESTTSHDLTNVVRVEVTPFRRGVPRRPRNWNGTWKPDPPRWQLRVTGDGWTADWQSPRPLVGQVDLVVVLDAELYGSQEDGVTGRIVRVQVVRDTVDRSALDQQEWRVVPALRELRDVAVSPRGFDHSTVVAPGTGTAGGPLRVPSDPYRPERGVLVTLDLDGVPPAPLRPALVPGAVAVHGSDVWVADASLPVLVCLRDGRTVRNLLWPGGIGPRPPRLHADPSGSWITGADGVWRADGSGVRRIATDLVGDDSAAATGSTLAVGVRDDTGTSTLRLLDVGGSDVIVSLPGARVRSLTAHGERFLLVLTEPGTVGRPADWDGRPWLAWLSPTGDVTHGARLPQGPYHYRPVPGSIPALLADEYSLVGVADDLSLVPRDYPGRRPLATWAAPGCIVVCTHPPGPASPSWAPLDGPPVTADDRPHWLLTELDPDTLEARRTTLVPAVPRDVGVDADATVWTVADTLRRCTGPSGSVAEPVDVVELLSAPDAAARPAPTWGWDGDTR